VVGIRFKLKIMSKKIFINESDKNNIIELYRSHNIILETRGSAIAIRVAEFLARKGIPDFAKIISDGFIRSDRNYYHFPVNQDGTLGSVYQTPLDGDSFAEYLKNLLNDIDSGDINISDASLYNLFTKLFLLNDANFMMRFISDRIKELDPTKSNFSTQLDQLIDFVENAKNNDIFKTNFRTESTYFQKMYELIFSEKFIDAGDIEKTRMLKDNNTVPKVLSDKQIERLNEVQIFYAKEIIKLINNWKKGNSTLKSEINDLINAYASSNFTNTEAYARAILLKLNQLETKGNDLGKQYLNLIREKMEKSGEYSSLLDSLNNMDADKAFRVIRDSAPQTVKRSIGLAFKDMLDVLPIRRKDIKVKDIDGTIKTQKKGFTFNLNKRFWIRAGIFALSGQFITPKEIYETIIKSASSSSNATKRRAIKNLYVRSVSGQILFPAINMAFWGIVNPIIDAIQDYINNNDNFFTENFRDWFGDSGKVSWTDFDRDETKEGLENFVNSFLSEVDKRTGKEGVTNLSWSDLVPHPQPYIDDLFNLLYNVDPSSEVNTVNPIDTAEVTTYRDNLMSFNNWLEDNDIEKKPTSIPKRLDDGAYEVILKGEKTPTYYIYDNNTFKQD
jgi:hypothetical protein